MKKDLSHRSHTSILKQTKKALAKPPSSLQKLLKISSVINRRKLKARRQTFIANQPPDVITEEQRVSLRGGRNTRDILKRNATIKYQKGQAYFKAANYTMAQKYFEQALHARLMLLGPNHVNLAEVHDALGCIAILQGDTKRADNHFDAVERLNKLCQTIWL
mmetsp:Transcript_7761/g.11310  ORF Transcript_7761/g.11310 Transcript_7761/m.11310 type:complete len:162 (+) Transcript_7761:149-634(+)|eukprot:5996702-Ditylum_brightwellii.AAC.1